MPRSELRPGRISTPGQLAHGRLCPGMTDPGRYRAYADGRVAVVLAQPDQEVITVSVISARQARTTRLARMYHAGTTEARAQAADRHSARAVLPGRPSYGPAARRARRVC